MPATPRASSVDTDGEKIELVMSRQSTAGAIKTHGSEGSDARGYSDSTVHHEKDIKCLNVFRSRRAHGKKDNDHWRAAILMKPCRKDNDSFQRNRRWQRPNNVSSRPLRETMKQWSRRDQRAFKALVVVWSVERSTRSTTRITWHRTDRAHTRQDL